MIAGFTNIYNIIDGFEGDKVKDPESVFYGKGATTGAAAGTMQVE